MPSVFAAAQQGLHALKMEEKSAMRPSYHRRYGAANFLSCGDHRSLGGRCVLRGRRRRSRSRTRDCARKIIALGAQCTPGACLRARLILRALGLTTAARSTPQAD